MATRSKAGSHGRTWTMLKNAYEDYPERFDNLVIKVYETYARTDLQITKEEVCRQYNIAPSCFSKIQDYVIIEDLVSDHTIDLAAEKSITLQSMHISRNGFTRKKNQNGSSRPKSQEEIAHDISVFTGRKTTEKIENARALREERRLEKKQAEEDQKKKEEFSTFVTYFTINPGSLLDYAKEKDYSYEEAVEIINYCVIKGLIDEVLAESLKIQYLARSKSKKQKQAIEEYFNGIKSIISAYKNGFTL